MNAQPSSVMRNRSAFGHAEFAVNTPIAITPASAAAVQRWLSVAAGQIAAGPASARLVTVFGAPYNAEELIARSHALQGFVASGMRSFEDIPGPRGLPLVGVLPALAADPAEFGVRAAREHEGLVRLDLRQTSRAAP